MQRKTYQIRERLTGLTPYPLKPTMQETVDADGMARNSKHDACEKSCSNRLRLKARRERTLALTSVRNMPCQAAEAILEKDRA
jgi:hypothetical protein